MKILESIFEKDNYATTPAGNNIYERDDSPELDKKRAEEFHTFVAKALFACQRARPDYLAVAVLTIRVKNPNETEWKKLIRLMKYCNKTKNEKLVLSIDNLHVLKWYIDSSFTIHLLEDNGKLSSGLSSLS